MDSVIISNPIEFEKKKAALKKGGAKQLHIVADFDWTFTKFRVEGMKVHSIISLIRDYDYLTPEYRLEAYALSDKYFPAEHDLSLSLDERKTKMFEWWTTHIALIAKHGMSKEIAEKIVREQKIHTREGLDIFLQQLAKKDIPVLIFSAAIEDLLIGLLQKEKLLFPNMHIVSNQFAYDKNGNVTGYMNEVIHVFNKDELVVRHKPYHNEIQSRKNVILLGDSLGDVNMANGIDHHVILRICFLNDVTVKNFETFKDAYDVIILNDGTFEYVNELLEEIIQ